MSVSSWSRMETDDAGVHLATAEKEHLCFSAKHFPLSVVSGFQAVKQLSV